MASEQAAVLDALNAAWGKVSVSDGYNLVFSLGEQAYRITSVGGKLKAEGLQTPEVKAAIAGAATHVSLADGSLVSRLRSSPLALQEQRKMLVSGDGSQIRALAQELGPQQAVVQAEVEAQVRSMNLDMVGAEEDEDIEGQRAIMTSDAVNGQGWHPGEYVEGMTTICTVKLTRWIHFSAFSTMPGNVGQGNYTAANSFLDVLTWRARQDLTIAVPVTYMWGAVAGIGMRLKAFGSQDLYQAASPEMMFNTDEAAMILRVVIGLRDNGPEWHSGHVMDPAMFAAMNGVSPTPGEGEAINAEQELQLAAEKQEKEREHKSKTVVGALVDRIHKVLQQESDTAMQQWYAASPGEDALKLREYQEALKIHKDFKAGELEPSMLAPLIRAHLKEHLDDASTEAGESESTVQSSSTAQPELWTRSYSKQSTAKQEASEMHIAGSWSDWMPEAFHEWDDERRCYVLRVDVPAGVPHSFQLLKGRLPARRAKVKSTAGKKTIPAQASAAVLEIRVNIRNDGRVQNVEWGAVGREDGTAGSQAPVPRSVPKEAAVVKPAPHLIAGSWDGWLAHSFEWSEQRGCYVCQVQVDCATATFQVFKGEGSGKHVRPSSSAKTWTLQGGSWEICGLPEATGRIRQVEWRRCPPASLD
mmetsp:Transcript_36773/g.84681  ORF Transcript_36773/g.84681 Transcript_36773/m.84681 type:complete len:643 (+) Transcript_36773:126-2054(+)